MGTEDVASILLRFANGARGAVSVSQISPGRKNSLQWEIDGSVAAAAWDSETPDHLWLGHRDRPNEILLRNPALMGAAGRAAAALPGGHVEGFADTFAAAFSAIYDDVRAGRPSPDRAYATFADGHVEMLIGDAVLESSRRGGWVAVARPA
jgi:prepilin-type processing-associated H-X9-DG protein